MLLLHLHPSIDSWTDCFTEIKRVIKIVLEDLFDENKNKKKKRLLWFPGNKKSCMYRGMMI
ncbi:hypothetical protein BRARA_C03955 [Brassica rapa]|uniref:Uncharacterized protein n=1 Tax=Brassica campestris TaxID=3711 RepID=A0A398A4U1_BRACM|nr:hypothetical protein BRARA_C03955 [Brassica rapa]